jgi:membrane protein implicated in regulation of membrane protease activity
VTTQPTPKRPYRDSLLLHFALAIVIVLVSWLTGGELGRALVFAAVYFVLATAWSWWRFRQRLGRP